MKKESHLTSSDDKSRDEIGLKSEKVDHKADLNANPNDFFGGLNVFKFLNDSHKQSNEAASGPASGPASTPAPAPTSVPASAPAPTSAPGPTPASDSQKSPLISVESNKEEKKDVEKPKENDPTKVEKERSSEEDDEVRRAAEIAMAISSSNMISPQQAMLLAGQDERQKQFLEEAKRRKQANPGWPLNVHSIQNMLTQIQNNNSNFVSQSGIGSTTNSTSNQTNQNQLPWTWPQDIMYQLQHQGKAQQEKAQQEKAQDQQSQISQNSNQSSTNVMEKGETCALTIKNEKPSLLKDNSKPHANNSSSSHTNPQLLDRAVETASSDSLKTNQENDHPNHTNKKFHVSNTKVVKTATSVKTQIKTLKHNMKHNMKSSKSKAKQKIKKTGRKVTSHFSSSSSSSDSNNDDSHDSDDNLGETDDNHLEAGSTSRGNIDRGLASRSQSPNQTHTPLKRVASKTTLTTSSSQPSLSTITNTTKSNTVSTATSDALSLLPSTSSHPLPPVTLQGIAWKRRNGLGKLSTKHAWERRKFALQGSKLIYYALLEDDTHLGLGSTGVSTSHQETPHEKQDPGKTSLLSHPYPQQQQTHAPEHNNKKLNIWEQAAVNLATATENINKNLKHFNIVVPPILPGSQNDPHDPRGVMDIVKDQVSIVVSTGNTTGAPTPFLLSLKIGMEVKWKICFDSQHDQWIWLKALTDVTVKKTLDDFSNELDPKRTWKVMKPNDDDQIICQCNPLDHGMKSQTTKETNDPQIKLDAKTESKDRSSTLDVVKDDNHVSNTPSSSIFAYHLSLNETQFYIFMGGLNFTLILSRIVGIPTFLFLLFIVNLLLWTISMSKDLKNKLLSEISKYMKEDKESKLEVKEDDEKKSKEKSKQVEMNKTVTKPVENKTFVPKAGSTAFKISNPSDPRVNKDNVAFPGWRQVSGSTLQVRSLGYSTSKLKRASPTELYECVAVDIYYSHKRVPKFGTRVDLTSLYDSKTFEHNSENRKYDCPDLFIVSIAFPIDPPKLTKSETDGEGINVSIYLKMKENTRKILEAITNGKTMENESMKEVDKEQWNGAKLFNEWCRRSPTDPKFQARFKVIPNMVNLEEIGLPSYISKYNSKPLLIKRAGVTGFLSSHPNDPNHSKPRVMEFEISLHPFPYIAKQAFSYLHQNYVSKLITTLGFVIEGRSDEELPEVVIGAMQLCYPNPANGIHATALFSGKAASSLE